MVLFNYSTKELTAKVVYYGPGLCGKTTNLQYIHQSLPGNVKGKMLSLATKTDRTLFFDFLPIDLGKIRGMQTRVQLYTVPGQVFYNETRKLVLKGADGIVFVADSQEQMLKANVESFRNLEDNLRAHGHDLSEMPHIIQFNKRDLPKLASLEEMNETINKYNAPFYESVATTGVGVQDSLKAITKLVLLHLTHKYDPKATPANPRQAAKRIPPPQAAPIAKPLRDSGAETVQIPLSAPDVSTMAPQTPEIPLSQPDTGGNEFGAMGEVGSAETHPGVAPTVAQPAASVAAEDGFAIDEAMAEIEHDFGADTVDSAMLGGTVDDAMASVERSMEPVESSDAPFEGAGLEAAMAAVESQMASDDAARSPGAVPQFESVPVPEAPPVAVAPEAPMDSRVPADAPLPAAPEIESILSDVDHFVSELAAQPPASTEPAPTPQEPTEFEIPYEPAPMEPSTPEVSFDSAVPYEPVPVEAPVPEVSFDQAVPYEPAPVEAPAPEVSFDQAVPYEPAPVEAPVPEVSFDQAVPYEPAPVEAPVPEVSFDQAVPYEPAPVEAPVPEVSFDQAVPYEPAPVEAPVPEVSFDQAIPCEPAPVETPAPEVSFDEAVPNVAAPVEATTPEAPFDETVPHEPAPVEAATPAVSFDEVMPVELATEAQVAPPMPAGLKDSVAEAASAFEIDPAPDQDWMVTADEVPIEAVPTEPIDAGLADALIEDEPHAFEPGPRELLEAVAASETAEDLPVPASAGDESTVLLTEVVSDAELFKDPDLDVASLASGEERVVMVPVEIGDAETGLRRFKLSIRLRLDPAD